MLDWIGAIGGIVLVDLVLSGDNALVIGAAAAKLPRKQRWLAISLGGGGAIVLRILFAVLATFLLRLPLLQAVGSVILLYIAVRLLMERGSTSKPRGEEKVGGIGEGGEVRKSLWRSLLMILVADATMSLDNVLAVGALADGQWEILIIGLLLSIILLLIGSALISELISRLPWLLDLASIVLAWTSANMLLGDIRLGPLLEPIPGIQIIVPVVAIAVVVLADIYVWRRNVQVSKVV